jgi:membrane protease YdiL (CAAX protease family)
MWSKKEKNQFKQYLILVFMIAWIIEAIVILGGKLGILTGDIGFFITYVLGGFGAGLAPSYAFYILLKRDNQIHGFKDFWKKIFSTNNVLKTILLTFIFGGSQFIVSLICETSLDMPLYYYIAFMPITIIGGGLEEPGWRGFLQPQLEKRFPFVVATLITGTIWSVWHLPLWMIEITSQSTYNIFSFWFLLSTFSFVVALLYKLTQSIFACILTHAWINVLGVMFTSKSFENLPDIKVILVNIIEIIVVIITIAIAIINRKIKIKTILRNSNN